MLDKNKLIKVKNRDNGSVGYTIPDLGNLHRNFIPGESKEITVEELQKLHYIPGGDFIIENCLLIEDKEVLKEIFQERTIEPEYFYKEEDVKNLLLNGSLDELLDCLDFAPNGVIDLVKKYAVDLKINNIDKRNAIFEKTGFNVTAAIEINEETGKSDEKPVTKRRVAVEENNAEEAAPQRRAPVNSKYKIIN